MINHQNPPPHYPESCRQAKRTYQGYGILFVGSIFALLVPIFATVSISIPGSQIFPLWLLITLACIFGTLGLYGTYFSYSTMKRALQDMRFYSAKYIPLHSFPFEATLPLKNGEDVLIPGHIEYPLRHQHEKVDYKLKVSVNAAIGKYLAGLSNLPDSNAVEQAIYAYIDAEINSMGLEIFNVIIPTVRRTKPPGRGVAI